MKPSDRIKELAGELLRGHGPIPSDPFEAIKAAIVLSVDAVALHLDEQHENDRRLRLVWTALANIGPGCTAANTNPLLERAGLGSPIFDGMSFETCREMILSAAKREGLI